MKRLKNTIISLFLSLAIAVPSINFIVFGIEENPEIITLVEDGIDNGYAQYHYEDEDGNIVNKEIKSSVKKKRNINGSSSLPSSYSSVAEGYGVEVGNQHDYGICWAYSSLSAVGVYNRKYYNVSKSDSNYSEMHLNYFKCLKSTDENDPLYNDGQNEKDFKNGEYLRTGHSVLIRGSGLISESIIPYSSNANSDTYTIDEKYRYNHTSGLTTEAEVISLNASTDTELVKRELIEHGALQMSFERPEKNTNEYFNYCLDNTAYCFYSGQSKTGNTNHAVTIVGYDDNFSKDNFNELHKPSRDGAWLVQNSWGTSFGINGYFWISYDEAISEIGAFKTVPADEYDKIYQYDGYNLFTSSKYYIYKNNSNYTKQACIFTADENNIIKGFNYFTESPAKLTVKMYRSITDASDPESGTLCKEQVFNTQYEGYHSFEFDEPIQLYNGEKFSIVILVGIADNESSFYYPVQGTTADKSIMYTRPGESFFCKYDYYANDKHYIWIDGSDTEYNYGDAQIKVYACSTHINIDLSTTELSIPYDSEYVLKLSTNAGTPTFTSSNPDVVSITESGLINALKCGTSTITVSVGTTSKDITVTVPHEFSNYVYNNDAKCNKYGTKTAKCDHCDEKSTIEDTRLADHQYSAWVTKSYADYENTGLMERQCSVCLKIDTFIIPTVKPYIHINNYKSSVDVDYKTTYTLNASTNYPYDYKIIWIDNKNNVLGYGNTVTFNEMTESVKICAEIYKTNGTYLSSSDFETINVKNGFFNWLKWVFVHLFNPDAYIVIQ